MALRSPENDLTSQLRHRDPETRRRARHTIAEEVRKRGGDLRATATALGVHLSTVRKWQHGGEEHGAEEPEATASDSARVGGKEEPPESPTASGPKPERSPFEDFRPEHRATLVPARAPAPRVPEASQEGGVGRGSLVNPYAEPTAIPAPPTPRPHSPPTAAPLFWPEARDPEPGLPPRIAFVLHAHLPWVLGHGTWPHGEEWLAEAVAHCYLPLIEMLQRLGEDGRRRLLTLSVTPVLAAQLADPRTSYLVEGYLEARLEAAEALRDHHPLASWWQDELARLRRAWQELDGDLVGALAALEGRGVIELSTAAATHPYLPLLHRPEHVRLQLATACCHHQTLFGRRPRGLWMPECAYRGRGPWHHPLTGAHEPYRRGNEELLAEHGIRWTVVDAHLVLGSEPLTGYSLHWPASDSAGDGEATRAGLEDLETPLARRLQPAWIGGSSVAAMVREPYTARQVWSREVEYPGDPRYLEFHKRHSESGLRLWRVTDAEADLSDKLPYWPADGHQATLDQARHFVDLVQSIPGLAGGVAVCPFDAELFGHWWYEGPAWLEEVLRRCHGDSAPRTVTPDSELAERPLRQRCDLSEGSWGEGGGHAVWLHPATEWMWQALRQAEDRVDAALARGNRRPDATRALLAQLMLMSASDWPFLVSRDTAADYAGDRFREHWRRLETLLDLSSGDPLPSWAGEDLSGMSIEADWWSRHPASAETRSKT